MWSSATDLRSVQLYRYIVKFRLYTQFFLLFLHYFRSFPSGQLELLYIGSRDGASCIRLFLAVCASEQSSLRHVIYSKFQVVRGALQSVPHTGSTATATES